MVKVIQHGNSDPAIWTSHFHGNHTHSKLCTNVMKFGMATTCNLKFVVVNFQSCALNSNVSAKKAMNFLSTLVYS